MPGQLGDVESPSSLHTFPLLCSHSALLTLPAAPQAAEQGDLGREYSRVLCSEGCGYTEKGDPRVMWGQYVGVGVCWGDTVSQRQDRAPSEDSFSAGSGKEACVGHCSLFCIPLESLLSLDPSWWEDGKLAGWGRHPVPQGCSASEPRICDPEEPRALQERLLPLFLPMLGLGRQDSGFSLCRLWVTPVPRPLISTQESSHLLERLWTAR